MKTNFENFIEKSIPNEFQRESLRLWVKNILSGNKNDKILILYSDGAAGKTTLTRLLSYLLDGNVDYIDCDGLCKSYYLDIIKDKKIAVFEGYVGGDSLCLIKSMVEHEPILVPVYRGKPYLRTEWPSIIITSNRMSNESIHRRSILIQMARVEVFEPDLLSEFIKQKELIVNWFLK